MNSYIFLVLTVIGNVAGNFLVKYGSRTISPITDFGSLIKFVFNPAILGGIAMLGLAFFAYAYALAKVQLAMAYPFVTSLTLLFVTIISVLYLGERLNMFQSTGLVLIFAGVWLLVVKS